MPIGIAAMGGPASLLSSPFRRLNSRPSSQLCGALADTATSSHHQLSTMRYIIHVAKSHFTNFCPPVELPLVSAVPHIHPRDTPVGAAVPPRSACLATFAAAYPPQNIGGYCLLPPGHRVLETFSARTGDTSLTVPFAAFRA